MFLRVFSKMLHCIPLDDKPASSRILHKIHRKGRCVAGLGSRRVVLGHQRPKKEAVGPNYPSFG